MSYTTFLGLKPVDSTRRGLVLPGDELIPEHMILQLPIATAETPTYEAIANDDYEYHHDDIATVHVNLTIT